MAKIESGVKVQTPKGHGTVTRKVGFNFEVSLDKRDYRGRENLYNFSKEELSIVFSVASGDVQAARDQAQADAARVIGLRAQIEQLQDELAEAEQKAGESKRAAVALIGEAGAAC